MAWFMAGVLIATFLYARYMESRIQKPKPAELDVMTANEGVSIPVVFGSIAVPNLNITWFGNKGLANAFNYKSDSYDIPYYSFGAQFAICHGKIDSLLDVLYQSKSCIRGAYGGTLLTGQLTTLEHSSTARPDPNAEPVRDWFLCVSWDVTNGQVNSTVDDGTVANTGTVAEYLQLGMSLPDGKGPHYYGVASLVLRGAELAGSPFLGALAVAVKRIHTRNGGDVQWYDEKAEIARPTRSRMDNWKYLVEGPTDSAVYYDPAYDDSAWAQGAGGIGNAEVDYYTPSDYGGTRPLPYVKTRLPGSANVGAAPNYYVKSGTSLWLRWDLGALPTYPLTVRVWHADDAHLWFNGHVIDLVPVIDASDLQVERYNSTAVIPQEYIVEAGPNVIALCSTVVNASQGSQGKYIYAGLQTGNDSEFPACVVDINPAHIIHEVLTDKIWGMGYNDANLDDASFRAAADTLFTEGLGMSFVWSQQMIVEDFLTDILRHISGVIYQDRSTGLFVLHLLRDDYAIADLVTLDEYSVSKVEDATRKQVGELVNTVTVTYTATMLGGQGSLTVYDEGVMAAQGGAVSSKIDYPAITSPVNASKLAIRDLRLLSSPLLLCKVTANRAAAALNIGDPFVLDWPDLGIMSEVMRVTEIDVGNGIDNSVKVTCVEDLFFFPKDAMYVPNDPIAKPKVNNPGQLVSDTYTTGQALDQRNKGTVACCFLGAHAPGSNTPIFEGGWTEGSTGTMTRGSTGLLPSTWFDGVGPDPALTDPSSVAAMLGSLVLVYTPDTISHPSITGYDEKHTGLYIVDDVGVQWDTDTTFHATHAKMHRAPDYTQSAAFIKGMIFQVNAGTAYGGHFIQFNTANAVLGNTPLAWSDLGTTEPWSDGYVLLKGDQLKSKVLSPDSTVTVTGTSGSGGFSGTGFPAISPGKAWSTPAGDWSVQLSSVEVSGASAGSITTSGVLLLVDHNGTSLDTLFEMQSAPLQNGTNNPLAMHYSAPQLNFALNDRIVLQVSMHTTSTTPVTMTWTFNAGKAIVLKVPGRVIPFATPAPIGFTTAILGS
jgi:hypothetical protein